LNEDGHHGLTAGAVSNMALDVCRLLGPQRS
jgi:hypothetical protein